MAMIREQWLRLRASAYGDIPFVLLGIFIGWNCDLSCAVKGVSMLPTLLPNEYILFVPYSLLHMKQLLYRPLVNPGDVVVMKISDELSVCKRVVKMTSNADVANQWGAEYFDDVQPAYYVNGDEPAGDTALSASPINIEKEWYAQRDKPTRSPEWDTCLDRVAHPSIWLWLEGDNKEDSYDSRRCGAMPVECLRGRVVAKIWPHFRRIH